MTHSPQKARGTVRGTLRSAMHAGLVIALCAVLGWMATPPLAAQVLPLPEVSPHAVAATTLGLTEVTIDYHRPGVKGREIWGGLVPWDVVWRAGANENTTINFSHPVSIEGTELPAGTYGLHMIPTEGDWTVIFSRNHTSWGSFSYDEAEDALRVTVTPKQAPHEEWLSYGFTDLTDHSAIAYLSWEKMRVPFEIATDTPAIVMETARNELRSTAGFFWRDWFRAADWVRQNSNDPEDLRQALEWAETSLRREERFPNLRLKAQLLTALGEDEGEAEELMARAAEIATEAEMNGLGYQHLQAGETEQALEIFRTNLERHPESWNCHDSLGEGLAAAGRTEEAIANYKKALEMAPEGQTARIESILERLQAE
jgi:tetratricopeptide (TPR) repeat protein